MFEYFFSELEPSDYDNGYLELMQDFSKYKKAVSREEFMNYTMKTDDKRIVVVRNTKNIIGAGTIFKLNKLHNNPIGQIEDVMIAEQYRSKGLGKLIIDKLTKLGIEEFKCYKVILNCSEKNIGFYNKCSFTTCGIQMKSN